MASIFVNRNTIYMSIFINGKQLKRTTGLTNTSKNVKYVEKELLPKFIAECSENINFDTKLSYYIDKFKKEKKHILKDNTYRRYVALIDKWIIPKYKNFKIKDIKTSILKDYLNEQYNLGKSAKSVELYRTVFSGIIQEAVFDDVLPNNPFKNIKRKAKVKPKITPLSAKEVRILLDNSSRWFRNYIGFATTLGLRSGELIALKWIDIKKDEIQIRRTRDFNRDTPPKTASSVRNLPMFESLKEFVESQREISGHLEYVFPRKNGLPWSDTQWIAKYHWYPLLEKFKLEKRRLYEMRHTFATNMLNSGHFKVTEISRMLGHTTTEYLFNVYSTYIESEKDDIPLNINIYK